MADNNRDDKDIAGKNGFIWWTGIVEDKQDPLKLGRCRVRCVEWHSDNKMFVPTEMLPWAMPAFPVNNTNTYAPKEGDMVFGFFLDGEAAQHPVMLGIFPNIPLMQPNPQRAFSDARDANALKTSPRKPLSKKYNNDGSGVDIKESDRGLNYPINLDEPSTSRLARNESIDKTFIQERKDNTVKNVPTVSGSWDEPETKYDARYPYNNVTETESGHITEFDDTPGKERIHVAHRTGTFNEIYPDGTKVEKVVGKNYQIIMQDDNVYIMGKCHVTIQGDAELRIKGDYDVLIDGECNIESKGNMKLVAPRIDWNP